MPLLLEDNTTVVAIRRCLLLIFLFCFRSYGQATLPVYTNNLVNGFADWGWAPHSYTNSGSYVYSGSNSISVCATNWQALWVYHSPFNTSLYSNISFWANGGPKGGQILQIVGTTNENTAAAYGLPALQANTWTLFTVPLSALGLDDQTNCTGFWFELTGGNDTTTNTFYLDIIQLNPFPAPAVTQITINAANAIRTADARWFGLNTADWDGDFDNSTNLSELEQTGLQFFRFPGGSESDDYHWARNETGSNTWQWATSPTNFAHIITNLGAQAIITANYGSGSASEAAGWVTNANLRNHWNFKYWEIGNEVYGGWETDSNAVPHDPYCYATNAANYIRLMKQADPTIHVGVVAVTGEDSYVNDTNHAATNSVTGQVHYGWTPVLLSTMRQIGTAPDFLIYHFYAVGAVGAESDPFLLQGDSNWVSDANNLRQMIQDYYGPSGTNIELLVTENNSSSALPGKQTVSLVNGIYYADTLAQLMRSGFNSYMWWDLRNGTTNGGNLDPSLYGWRQYGDEGIVDGLGNDLTNRYPQYFTASLMQNFVRPGDIILNASSGYALLGAYAARRTNGALTLLVINKDSASSFAGNITLTNFVPSRSATVYSYGMPQDNAAEVGSENCGVAQSTFAGASTNFTYSFPPYSVTLFSFSPAAPGLNAYARGNSIIFQLSGQASVPYMLQSSTYLLNWTNVLTNEGSFNITNALPSGQTQQFWRAVWIP